MLGIINTIFNIYLWGLIIYGIIMMLDIKVSFIRDGIPIYGVPLEYIGSIVKPITIGNRRLDLSFLILYFLLRLIQNILH
jgi:hypothetical protein